MQEILFRAKRKDNEHWVEGSLVASEYILDHKQESKYFDIGGWFEGQMHEIIPKTVSQYIGINDENKIRIFKDDIVEFTYFNCPYRAVVRFHKGCFELYWKGDMGESHSVHVRFADHIKVIGNIIDNPELLV